MKNYKAIVTDLDGTLLNFNSEVGEKDLEILNIYRNKGYIIIIATGRSIFSYKRVISDDFPVDWLIFDAGAGIMNTHTKELLFSSFMTNFEVKSIASKLNDLRLDFQIRGKIPDSHIYSYKKHSTYNPDFDRINTLYKDYNKELQSVEELGESSRIISISPDESIVSLIENEFSEYSIIRATSPIDYKSVWMEIYPKGINKGNALKYLCNNIGLQLDEIIGFGNDFNDVHFLDLVGKPYIVSNSPNVLRQKYSLTSINDQNPLSCVLTQQ